MTIRKFKTENKYYKNLYVWEKKVLKILEEAVEDLEVVYRKQVKSGFYDLEITKKEIDLAAKENPEILSPFTYISRKEDKLVAIPYHQLYEQELKPIAEKIEKAAIISQNNSFKKYLKARAKSLLDGSYREADIIWLNVKNSNIDFSIGPFERYLDETFFIKRVFQAHVGIIDSECTKLAEKYKEALYSSAKISDNKLHTTDIPKKGVQISVQITPVVTGYAADALFSGEHFPSDTNIALDYGSKIIIYISQLTLKFEELHYPIFKKIFEKKFAEKYSKESLLGAAELFIILYELGKQLHKFQGAREGLKELFGIIDEANGFASGIQHSKHLVVKGLISEDELEAIIIIHFVWMFSEWLTYMQTKNIENYILGDAIAINNYLASGALKEQNGIYWPNFSRMFFQIETLADQLVHILQKGNYSEAEKMIKSNASLENFERLGKSLQNLLH